MFGLARVHECLYLLVVLVTLVSRRSEWRIFLNLARRAGDGARSHDGVGSAGEVAGGTSALDVLQIWAAIGNSLAKTAFSNRLKIASLSDFRETCAICSRVVLLFWWARPLSIFALPFATGICVYTLLKTVVVNRLVLESVNSCRSNSVFLTRPQLDIRSVHCEWTSQHPESTPTE